MKTTSGQDALTTPFDLPLKRGDYGDEVFDNGDYTVATLYGHENKPETIAQRDYIVRAVNSFDDMLAALKALLACDPFDCDAPSGTSEEMDIALKLATAAIAKAGGQ